MRNDLDLALADLLDLDIVAQVARAALDLDTVVQEFLKGRDVEDLVRDGLTAVDGVLSEASAGEGSDWGLKEGDVPCW